MRSPKSPYPGHPTLTAEPRTAAPGTIFMPRIAQATAAGAETPRPRPKRKRADRESSRSRTARAPTFTRNSDRGLALPRLEVPLDLARFVRARNALDQADHMLGLLADERDHDGVVASTIEDQVAMARDSVAEAALVLLDA